MKSLFLSIAALTVWSGTALSQVEQTKVSEIVTGGRGEVRVTPDKAALLVTVDGRAGTATEAGQQTARTVASVISALRAAGASPGQITNGGYNLTRDYETQRGRPRGFVARNTIRTEVTDLAKLGSLIDAALAGGATEVSSPSFS